MEKKDKIRKFLKEYKVITTQEALKLGVNSMFMSRAVKKGLLYRVVYDVYTDNPDILFDPKVKYIPICVKYPYAVIALISALNFYELTDEEERKIWIAIKHPKKILNKQMNIEVIRLRNNNFEIGVDEIRVGKRKIRMYDQEKCIIDAFKYLTEEIAIKALKSYLKRPHININKLIEYGKQLQYPIDEKIKLIVT